MTRALHRDLESALRIAIDAMGGPARVGHQLRKELDPVLAAQWVSHCANRDHRQKFSLDQVQWIFREAYQAAEHEGFESFAAALGYRVVGIEPQAELEELSRRAVSAANEAMSLSTEVAERMRHAGLKV